MMGQLQTLKILQYNIRKSLDIMMELFQNEKTTEYDVIAIQEPPARDKAQNKELNNNPDSAHVDLSIPETERPRNQPAETSVTELVEIIAERPRDEHVALEDFNLHHPTWGGEGTKVDADADELIAALATHGMVQLLEQGTVT
ncbi:hypothetical protein N7G274_010592 [Stereocaulon virgatum]|uniref:Endonuclease/exonuclease/phosphatase domain-containing protein n=1 Tax=Stereocaulon virgatum TaxID=373712 RepID=A0ABR3ZT73_9LECA